jgi:phosphohistidine phosphatase SixA
MNFSVPRLPRAIVVTALLLAGSVCASVWAEDAPDGLLSPNELIDALQQGGLVVYFRHAQTDHGTDDQHPVDLSDCSTQRNLSEQGRSQATSVAEAIGRLGIEIGEVVSSPFCRCRDTAQLAFGRYRVDDHLYFAVVVEKEQRAKQAAWLRNMLSIPPREGTNRVIVSHTANLREATGIWPKPEGVAWVIRPQGNGQYEALGKIEPSFWPTAN